MDESLLSCCHRLLESIFLLTRAHTAGRPYLLPEEHQLKTGAVQHQQRSSMTHVNDLIFMKLDYLKITFGIEHVTGRRLTNAAIS
jgi:hypothetical protein